MPPLRKFKEEIAALLDAYRRSPHPYLYSIVNLALLSGVRFGEIANLKWGDVDFEQRQVILHEIKNGDSRIVSIINEIERAFRECQAYSEERKVRQATFKHGRYTKRAIAEHKEAMLLIKMSKNILNQLYGRRFFGFTLRAFVASL